MGVTLPKSGVGAKVTPVGTMRIAWCARAGSTGSEVVGNTYTNQSELHMSNTKKKRDASQNCWRLDGHLEHPDQIFPGTPLLICTNPGPSGNHHPAPGSQRHRSLVGP